MSQIFARGTLILKKIICCLSEIQIALGILYFICQIWWHYTYDYNIQPELLIFLLLTVWSPDRSIMAALFLLARLSLLSWAEEDYWNGRGSGPGTTSFLMTRAHRWLLPHSPPSWLSLPFTPRPAHCGSRHSLSPLTLPSALWGRTPWPTPCPLRFCLVLPVSILSVRLCRE